MAVTVDGGLIPGDDTGGEIVLVEVNSQTYAMTGFTAGTSLINIKDLASSDVTQTADITQKKNEKGEVRKRSVKVNLMTTGAIMQGDKGTLDFMASYVKDKTFLEFKRTGPVGTTDDWYVKLVQITPAITISRGKDDTNTPYEAIGIIPQTAITYTATILATLIALLAGAPYYLTDFPNAAFTIPTRDGYFIASGSF